MTTAPIHHSELPELPEHERDVWDLSRMGVERHSFQPRHISFTSIRQTWLRTAAKQFIRYHLALRTVRDARVRIQSLQHFSAFLDAFYPQLQPDALTRAIIIEYLGYLADKGFAPSTRSAYIGYLRSFLEQAARESWASVPAAPMIFIEDYPPPKARHPRFIPQEVLAQLQQHLDALPLVYRRMVIVLQECGMRISELCTLPYNCLTQDSAGDWFLRYYQSKMKKEHTIPVSREVVEVIQQQQAEMRERWGTDVPALFLTLRGKVMYPNYFTEALNTLAREKDFRDAAGQPYTFETHQFRHTVGTQMINNGVPQHMVQRFLGHESPEMTARYAHILDQTLKDTFVRFKGTTVNVLGQIVAESRPEDAPDLQWVKRNILAQALPNGSCSLPLVAGPCPHANACLTCTHFRTDARFLPQHHEQLETTRRLLEQARTQGWTRQAEMNERVQANLERIIITLEASNE